jgi:hypothetical protein
MPISSFWDISGFSDMCNQFVTDPSTIILFLQKYFNEANRIIHKHNGILDKFMGGWSNGIFRILC